jgi:hypothetical protein
MSDLPQGSIFYVIYSADILGSDREIDGMGPFRSADREAPYATPFPGKWTQTEGDEQYDYGYLADEDEGRNLAYLPADEHDEGEGRHRKWVAELTLEDWQTVARALCIDIEDDGMPTEYTDTMGSITEYGHIPAVAIDNTEGWTPTRVIDSMLYVSIMLPETS